MIKVRVYSSLNYYLPKECQEKWFELTLDNGLTIAKLIESLRIPEEAVAIVVVNGQAVSKHFFLRDCDEVAIYPIISGG
jgi:sulfur carrier protein ThiS